MPASERPRLTGSTRAQYLWRTYRMTIDEYNAMAAKGCHICGEMPTARRRLFVDHEHESGAVRGLLCAEDNRLLGAAGDSPDILKAAIAYLRKGNK